ncbi:B12-binding domain-containing protein [Deinococcus sp.]|uniref:MerR family transcriptional regulator n=1 Tax=Deinococcus sp. TaxID=47478 RepID=UPI00286DF0A3|nr:B12-binding domain-containing protein [Deinococcus sp.]
MAHPSDTTALYTASEVETRTGVPATTLRQWERRYGFPSPSRTAGGYRLYSPFDLACIAFIQARQEEGVPVSRAVELAREHLASPSAQELPLVGELVRALLRPDHREAGRLLGQAHAAFSAEEVMMNVMQPTLSRIGLLWESGEITVAHEHQASAFLKVRLSQMLDAAGNNELGPAVVVACGPGEHHEVGLMMLAVTLRRKGIQVHYLGGNTPLADTAVYARSVGAQALLFSLNTDDSLEQFRTDLHDLSGLEIPIFFGGQMLNLRPALAQELGGHYLGASATKATSALMALFSGEAFSGEAFSGNSDKASSGQQARTVAEKAAALQALPVGGPAESGRDLGSRGPGSSASARTVPADPGASGEADE